MLQPINLIGIISNGQASGWFEEWCLITARQNDRGDVPIQSFICLKLCA